MARDAELRLSFSDVSAATNVAGVLNDISASSANRSALVTLTTTANQWSVGYSDALNFTHWRNQVGDITNLTSGTPTSAIPGDPILPNSTSLGNYFLRASVSPIGFVGPAPWSVIVQAADDSGAGTAGSTFFQQSASLNYLPNCTAMTSVDGTAASPAVFTPTGAVPPTGTIIMFQTIGGATGVTARTPYVVSQVSATTFQLRNSISGTAVNLSVAMTAGTALVGNNATRLTVASIDDATDRVAFNETVNVGDTIIFGSLGSITGLSAHTLYYVTSVNSLGATLSTSSGGATVALSGSVGTPFVGRVNFNLLPAIFPSAGSGTTITTATPHGLVPGQVVVPSGASAAGGLTNGVAYYVLTTPTATTFTVSATINGTAAAISATPNGLFVGAMPRIVNVDMGLGVKPWLRMAIQQLNGANAQDGYVMIYNADFSVGRDSSIS